MSGFLDRPAAIRPDEELDLARLEAFIYAHFPESPGSLSVQQFPSGHSNLTYSIRLGSREMILRRPPFGSKVKSAHDMGREFRVLSKLHAAYPLAPEVLLFCDDVSILGAPFYLMQPIRGIILRRDLPSGLQLTPETLCALSESFVENLARLHSLDADTIGLADLGKPVGYLERQVNGWIERYHGSATSEIPEAARISAWLRGNIPAGTGASIIHNDYKYDNLVLAPEDLTRINGVLDWEMCTLGDPLSDLGTALAYWVEPADSPDLQKICWGPTNLPGSLTRAQLVEKYARLTGRDVSRIAFYLAFARFKVAVIVQQIYYRYHHGLTKDARFAWLHEVAHILIRSACHCADTGSI